MNRRLQLINWVKIQHEGQLIKETGLPYFEHVLAVANTAALAAPLTFEIGLCHDLFEKTNINPSILHQALIDFGYDAGEADQAVTCVAELSRHFTKNTSPLPKKERKALEDERLLTISRDAQTVKYADMLYNANWMVLYDQHHAPTYLKRMTGLLNEMTSGDSTLREMVLGQFFDLLLNI